MSGWRELTDDELFELSQSNERRVDALTKAGVQLIGVVEHYHTTLLEEIAGERAMAIAREKHHKWLAAMLDEHEPQVRQAMLARTFGLNGQAPSGA